MSDSDIPSLGRIVHYTLSAQDVEVINRRREISRRAAAASSEQIFFGNVAKEGDVFPMMITKIWGNESTSAVNGQVYLDGNDIYWVTSVKVGEGPQTFKWPTRK
jgi:hypothetical protein